MNHSTFADFGFAEPLSRALEQCAYVAPTPIQSQALAPQLANRDMIALAETGSGKTAAFLLPLLNELARSGYEPKSREVATLILAPTRELAVQIDGEVASLARNMRIRRAVVLGGVGKGGQINALKRGVHVMVATPGRLLDLVSTRHADLRSVRTLVLDEADRMFDMGFIHDIRKIVSALPTERRTALFSATMPPEVRRLSAEILRDPVSIDLSPKQIVVERIAQKLMLVRAGQKQSRLHALLDDPGMDKVIVFTRTKRGADKVADRLGMASIRAAAIHGNKAQNARQRALNDFASGRVRVLVATDIAARGIDVSGISHVVNFDIPHEPETYVHRIGRTARKGTNGTAISLCDPAERSNVVAIERLMKQKIDVVADVGGDDLPAPDTRASTGNPTVPATPRGQQRAEAHPDQKRSRDGGRKRDRKPYRPSTQASADKPHKTPRHKSDAAVSGHSDAATRSSSPAPRGKPARKDGPVSSRDNWNGEAPPKFLRPRNAVPGGKPHARGAEPVNGEANGSRPSSHPHAHAHADRKADRSRPRHRRNNRGRTTNAA